MRTKKPNYTVVRCQTTDKLKILSLVYGGEEYKIIKDHIDIVYYNGDNRAEKKETKEMIKREIETLKENGIIADSQPKYIDDWIILEL